MFLSYQFGELKIAIVLESFRVGAKGFSLWFSSILVDKLKLKREGHPRYSEKN